MRIIVTGGAGFIGSNLSKKLLQEGHELLIIDDMHHYYPIERKEKQLASVKEAGDFLFIKKNLLHDVEDLRPIFQSFQADCIVHLAAIPGVALSIEKPNEYIDYDIKATVNVLKLAGESNVQHFIFASSSSVYGEQMNIPLKEEMATGKVVSPYAAAKFGAESFCHAFAGIYKYKMTILRFFTVYGPGGRPDMAISQFIKQLRNNEEITIYGDGTSRDYTYIDDCVDGILCAIYNAKSNGIYNIGTGQPVSLREVVDALKGHFPGLTVKQSGMRLGDVSATWADITKATEELGFVPKHTFHEGLAKTVVWSLKNEAL